MALTTPAHTLALTLTLTHTQRRAVRLNDVWPLGVALELPET